jgi:hypothetical protein
MNNLLIRIRWKQATFLEVLGHRRNVVKRKEMTNQKESSSDKNFLFILYIQFWYDKLVHIQNERKSLKMY